MGQYGVAIPGGAEAPAHARRAIEEAASSGNIGFIATVERPC